MLRHGNIFVVAPYYCAYDNLINHLLGKQRGDKSSLA